jgi:Mrp family chromosome partitioning ATPase/capsular polysaccharide biosynthesis protein
MSQPEAMPGLLPETFDAGTYLRPIWRWKWVVVLVVIVATGGTYFLSSRQPKHYVSSTSVLVADADPAGAVDSPQPVSPPTPQQMEDLAILFTDQAITADVYRDLGLPLGSAGKVSVAPQVGAGAAESSILVVTADSRSPTLAARLANTYVTAFLASQRSAQATQASADLSATRRVLDTLANTATNAVQRQQLITQEAQLRTLMLSPSAGARPIDAALPPSGPSSPRPTRDAILGGIIGLLLGLCIAFGLDFFDRRLVQVSSVESAYAVPVLAVLPHARNPAPMQDGRPAVPSSFIESIRSLRINIAMTRNGKPPRTLLVASAIPGEGKSTVARDLALVYAEAGESVLLIDADLRRPTLAKLFNIDPAVGLAQVLRHEVRLIDAVSPVYWAEARDLQSNGRRNASAGLGRPATIDLLDYGETVPNPVNLLGSAAMASALAAVCERYDVVILDSAPLLAVADTVPLLELVESVLLVARLGLSTRDSANRLAGLLQRAPEAQIVGVVTNDMSSGGFRGEKYGSYGYDSHAQHTPGDGAYLDQSVLPTEKPVRD